MEKNIYLKKLLLLIYLVFGLSKVQAQCTVTAIASVGPNGVVSFVATGSPSNSNNLFNWYFPGSPTGSSPYNASGNATATYTANGTYTVYGSLYNSVSSCTSTAILVVVVNTNTVAAPVCTLNVTYTAPTSSSSCNGSAVVTAPSNMCGAISYAWSNGATGTSVSGLCPATTYDVMATSPSGVNCCSVSIGVVSIPSNPGCNLVANFNWTSSSNGGVNFNNTSTSVNGGATYSWNFGDGGTSTSASPAHTYSANGTYVATLTVNNNVSPACTSTKVLTVVVNSYCTLNAGFTTSNITSNTLQFTNGTTGGVGPLVSSWSFGDGTSSSLYSPSHTYTATGTYTVLLIATNSSVSPGCADSAVAVVNISTVCVANASFSLSPSGIPQIWNALPLFPSNVIAATWAWGDGTFSNTLYTSHTYPAAGNYSMCLTVTVSCGSVNTFCSYYYINRSSDDNTIVTVNVVDPSQATGIKTTNGAGNIDYTISPNPNNGTFNLNLAGLPAGPVKVSVYNLVGQVVYSTQTDKTEATFSRDIQLNETSGVYFIQVNSNNKTLTKKVVITK